MSIRQFNHRGVTQTFRFETIKTKVLSYRILFIVFVVLLSTFNFQLSTAFSQEPIKLPSVTITGEDKSEDIFERHQEKPRIIMGELPKVSSVRRESPGSFLSLYFSAGGYDYLDWKMTGGKESTKIGEQGKNITYLVLVDKLRIGSFGSAGRLRKYNTDNFNVDFSFPFFGNTNLFSSLKYKERNESLTHPLVGGLNNVVNHQARDAELNLGWRGKVGNLVCLSLCPYYGYTGINDERINVDTQVIPSQEISGGLKINAQADMKNLSLVGDLKIESSKRIELIGSGANVNVYLGGKFRISRLNLGIGLGYVNSYLFSTGRVNPEINASYRFDDGLLLRAKFKGETVFPSYKLFAENYIRFNSGLKEEQDWIFSLEAAKEFGKRENRLRGDGNLKFFHKGQENFIFYGNRYNLWQPSNIPEFTTNFGIGLSVGVRYSIGKGNIYGRVNYTLQQTIPESIPYVPKQGILTSVGYEFGNFRIEINGNYYGSCWTDTSDSLALVIPGYFLANFNVSLGITDKIFIFFNGENLFDTQDYILDNYPVIGRNFRGGMELKF